MYLCNIQPMLKYRDSPKILPSYLNSWADFGIENFGISFTIGGRTDGLGKDCN